LLVLIGSFLFILGQNLKGMKKIYAVVISILMIQVVNAQVPTCSLDPAFISSNKKGVYPDSAVNFSHGDIGIPYVQNITVKVPLDTMQPPFKFCFNRVVLVTPTNVANYNLPPGLVMGSSTSTVLNGTVNGAPSFSFAGNANNCLSIYGTPTTNGSYTLALQTKVYATLTGGTCPPTPTASAGTNLNNTTLTYYVINIGPVGLNEIVNTKNFELRNFPNPFDGKTSIKFNVRDESTITIKMRDVLGKTVSATSFKTKFGENTYEFDGSKLPQGIYFYTISYKNYSETKRMIVASN
jgi:hypothetical protein